MKAKELFAFIIERYRIHRLKETGEPKPWTDDPILRMYRFCNVYRELDTVTQWIATNWRTPHAADKDLWFAMVVARLVNWPGTLGAFGYPVPWKPERFVKLLQNRASVGVKIFSGAYIVSTNGVRMDKAAYLAERVLTPLWVARDIIRPRKGDSLHHFYSRLSAYNGMGSFLAAQVVADIKYIEPLKSASDWWTFAASGPGSRRGLNRVIFNTVDAGWNEERWHATLMIVKAEIDPLLAKAKMPPIHAQDLQNCLCEFDKYERVRLGEGRPRSLYPGV